jgi:adenosylcobinamide kinase/adenosylcobinamide-phosphate guanylyltransferase
MGRIIFITGGARSGKSSYAVERARAIRKKKIFVATCVPEDKEMRERVRLHKRTRPSSWRTVEPNERLAQVLKQETRADVVILIDCLTLFIAGLLLRDVSTMRIKKEVQRILSILQEGRATVFIVSNEVGAGLVPETKLGRDFRDIVGICNRMAASVADEVNYIVTGIPLKLKSQDE